MVTTPEVLVAYGDNARSSGGFMVTQRQQFWSPYDDNGSSSGGFMVTQRQQFWSPYDDNARSSGRLIVTMAEGREIENLSELISE